MALPNNDLYEFADFQLQPARRVLQRNGERIPIAPKSFEVLLYLVQHAGRVVLKDELLKACWPGAFVEEGNLTQHVFWLRKALAEKACQVVTVPGRGYEFTGEVRLIRVPAAVPVEPGPPPPIEEAPAPAAPPPARAAEPNVFAPQTTLRSPELRRRFWIAGSAVLAVCASVTILWAWKEARQPKPLRVTGTRRITNDVNEKCLGDNTSLITDGTSLFFTEKENEASVAARVLASGGPIHRFRAPFPDARLAAYSQKRNQLLFGTASWELSNKRLLMTSQPDGSGAASLHELVGHDGSWSPDEQKLVFASGRLLYISDQDGANASVLYEAPSLVYFPRWSPDGSRIRFSEHFIGMKTQLWEISVDGSGLHQLFADQQNHDEMCCGTWSKDGRYFFFSAGPSNHQEIWASSERPDKPQKMSKPFLIDGGPIDRWLGVLPSQDATKLWAVGADLRVELDRVDAKTREIKPALGGPSIEGVSFSKDRQWMAFTQYPEGTLWVSRVDGSEKRQLTADGRIARFPKWSPDGKSICFLAASNEYGWKLYLVDVQTQRSRLLSNEAAQQGIASWSPDGKKLAFGHLLNSGDEHAPDISLQMLDLDSNRQSTVKGSAGLSSCRWSPDGRFISALNASEESLMLFDVATQKWSKLVDAPINDVAWSPDSRSLYYDTRFGNKPVLMRIDIPSGKSERWASLEGFRRGGFFEPWLGMDQDGSPLVLRNTSIEEVYELSLSPTR